MEHRIAALLGRPDVKRARDWLEVSDSQTLETQRALAAIPAPTGDEASRGACVAGRFAALGLRSVTTDEVGNVIARLGDGGGPGVVLAAHLDTVFGPDTPHTITVSGPRMLGPGIGDNARGLAALLALAQACVTCQVRLARPLTFAATVGEEGAGDLRGARHLLSNFSNFSNLSNFSNSSNSSNSSNPPTPSPPTAFIALDGPGMDRIVHRGTGARRFRAMFRGPGGHSWSAFGVANPAHAAGAAAGRIARLRIPPGPRATVSVVRLGGGTALNTIPSEAWLDVDLRAESEEALESLEKAVLAACERCREAMSAGRTAGSPALRLSIEPLGRRPCGSTGEPHPLVQAALAATRALGFTPVLAAASTDANAAMARGLPAIALGAGGTGGDAHLATEWYDNTNGSAGILRALLVALAAAEF